MMKYIKQSNQKGFTLIELLIVIVIVGILAGVLIAVIDPVKQQNRSKNAAVKSAITKVSFAINAARSGLGTLPDETTLGTELNNITVGSNCDTVDTLDCDYTVAGTSLADTCGSGDPDSISHGVGTSPCSFSIKSIGTTLTDGAFRVFGKKHKLNSADTDESFVFDSTQGLYLCPSLSADTLDLPGDCVLSD